MKELKKGNKTNKEVKDQVTTAEDMGTMAAIGDGIVDTVLGGHTDDHLTTLFTGANKGLYHNEKTVIRLLIGLVGELIDKVYDLENPT